MEKVDRSKSYSLEEALKILKENKSAKFDESVELHIKLGIDPKKGEQQMRGAVVLPHGTGKSKKIAVITDTKQKEAKEAGADIVGGEEMIEKMKKKINFDVLVATPEMMPKLAPIGKILGPKGLMPNPKTETVTQKIKETVEALKKGKAAYRSDDGGNAHIMVGKLSFPAEKLSENVKAVIDDLNKNRPESVKGKLFRSITLCSTMSPGIKVII